MTYLILAIVIAIAGALVGHFGLAASAWYLFAGLVAVVSFGVGGIGFMGAADPEGRGGNYVFLMIACWVICVFAVCWLIWMGFWDIKAHLNL